MAAPARIRLSLLGSVELLDAGSRAVDEVLAQPKLVALLAYLAVPSVGTFRRRDTVVGALWPDLGQERARAALRKAIHTLRTRLGADVIQSRGDEDLALSAVLLWCDVTAFTEAAEAAELSQALELYRGDLMPGFHVAGCAEYDRWLEEERASARERAAAAAWALAQRFEGDSQFSAAAQWARRATRFSWSDERALRRALGMLDRLHDRAGALRLYDEFASRLRADLDVEPSAETVALVERIRGSASSRST